MGGLVEKPLLGGAGVASAVGGSVMGDPLARVKNGAEGFWLFTPPLGVSRCLRPSVIWGFHRVQLLAAVDQGFYAGLVPSRHL